MHKIDGPGHVSGQFVSEDVATGRAPTLVTPEWLNAVQGELVNLVQAAGLTLDKGNPEQVLAALKVIFGDGPGAVTFFARSTAPTGYIKANGAAVSRAAYSALFAAIGTTYGAGDGATTFNLPELRGEFVRAWDDGRGVDTWRALGSAQVGTNHPFASVFANSATTGYLVTTSLNAYGGTYPNGTEPDSTVDSRDAVTTSPYMSVALTPNGVTGNGKFYRSRPRNVALLACIKY
jgi:phage-related tail fiber protein